MWQSIINPRGHESRDESSDPLRRGYPATDGTFLAAQLVGMKLTVPLPRCWRQSGIFEMVPIFTLSAPSTMDLLFSVFPGAENYTHAEPRGLRRSMDNKRRVRNQKGLGCVARCPSRPLCSIEEPNTQMFSTVL